jgi:opacity protein-like surface antigen
MARNVTTLRQREIKEIKMKNVKFIRAVLPLTAAIAAGSALPALAGGMGAPVVEPPVMTPAPVVQSMGGDWTGGWVAGKLGYADADAGANGGNSGTYGIAGGYDWDFGQWVAGAALDWEKTDVDLGGTDSLKDIARLKFRAGADLGRTLVYATAGPARANADVAGVSGRDNGWFAGIGADYALNDKWTVGGEILSNKFDNFQNTGTDLKATTATINVGLRF